MSGESAWIHWSIETDEPDAFRLIAPRCAACGRPVTGEIVVRGDDLLHAACLDQPESGA